jgi:hypothetical protein
MRRNMPDVFSSTQPEQFLCSVNLEIFLTVHLWKNFLATIRIYFGMYPTPGYLPSSAHMENFISIRENVPPILLWIHLLAVYILEKAS